MLDEALLLSRLVIGLLFAGHGAQKLFGWFGGYGLKGTGGFMESLGMRPGMLMAFMAGLLELAGGLLFAIGLFTPIAAAFIVITMLVAIVKVHGRNGLWVTSNGIEYNLVLIAIALSVAMSGAGAYSLDSRLFS